MSEKQALTPREARKKRDDTDLLMFSGIMDAMSFMIGMVMLAVFIPLADNANGYFRSQSYEGKTHTKDLLVNDSGTELNFLQDPGTPLSWVNIYNRGPNEVQFYVNGRANPISVLVRAHYIVSRLGAEERINTLYFYCAATQTALLDVDGEY